MTHNVIDSSLNGGEFEQPESLVEATRRGMPEEVESGDWIRVGDIALSPGLRQVLYRNKELRLTSAEFSVLEHLLRFRGRVISREQLVRAALGRRLGVLDRSLDVHISRLRRKLAQSGADNGHIKAVRGAGYIYTAFLTDAQP